MSLFRTTFFAQSIMKQTNINVVLPNDVPPEMLQGNKHYERPAKTLMLLHGFSGNSDDWLLGSQVQEMALKYNLAIIMPSGDNSFYLDAKGIGNKYGTYVGVELLEFCRNVFHLSDKAEDTFIGGLSMGGFGALHTGLKYPEKYSKIFALSSALIVNNIKSIKPGFVDPIADYDYYEHVFGTLSELDQSENNPEYLVEIRQSRKEKIQPIYMACGTDDFLIRENREFRDFLISKAIDLTYRESPGIHDWKFWNDNLEPAIRWLLGEKD